MNLFQQQKNKHFSYTPRHLRESQDSSDINIKSQWETMRSQGKSKSKPANKLVVLLIVLGMIIVVWFILNHYEIS